MWVFEGLDSFGVSSFNEVLTVLDGRRVDFVILRKISRHKSVEAKSVPGSRTIVTRERGISR